LLLFSLTAGGSALAEQPLPGTPNVTGAAEDRAFVAGAATAGMTEIRLGELALQRSQDPTVRSFARRMIDDHTAANAQLKELATRKGLTLPTEMTPSQKMTYDRLSRMSGPEFDREYLRTMARDHDMVVRDFKRQSEMGHDPDLRMWAMKTLPTLQRHDQMAHSAESQPEPK
jgi:putative membrane protein